MAIMMDRNTKILVQGATGHQGSFHMNAMIELGSNVVAGVTPGKGGTVVGKIKIFDSVKEAVNETGANSSVVFVPSKLTKDAVIEAIDAGIKLIVIITEHVPSQDMLELNEYSRLNGARIIGPNGPGIAVPGIGKMGIIPNGILKKGVVGVVSRSGTLTYEIVDNINKTGLGESTIVGIGGDKVIGTRFTEVLKILEDDDQTKGVVIVGEIGGGEEENAAAFIKNRIKS